MKSLKSSGKTTSRREFLKLASTFPLGYAASKSIHALDMATRNQTEQQNVLILVFDALSAYNFPLHGYPRNTAPNIARLAEKAIVYHNHYAGGNFTTPGTASILTGALPWSHRALQPNGTVIEPFLEKNIFSAFNNYFRTAYTHNPWANTLLEQLSGNIDELIPWVSLFLESYDTIIQKIFKNDYDAASVSWLRNTDIKDEGFAYSLFLSHIYETLKERSLANLRYEYPRGIPSIGEVEAFYILDQAIDWLGDRISRFPQPFLGYFHFLPPHGPYRTSIEFANKFANDGYVPVVKPLSEFSEGRSPEELLEKRTKYDEFILYADNQFDRFFNHLKNNGVLDNTWVILTSDHGEMFERGVDGHSNNSMFQPVVRVPMIIFEPGRNTGEHVYSTTSAIDILPTALTITGQNIPDWAEGKILPPFNSQYPDLNRSVYSVRANQTQKNHPITQTSTILSKGKYKLHYYLGYEERGLPHEFIKLFDLESDPEELNDLSLSHKEIAAELQTELKMKLEDVNTPYL